MENKIFVVEIEITKGDQRDALCAWFWNEKIEGIEEQETCILVYALQHEILKRCIHLYQPYSYQFKELSCENWNSSWEKNYEDVYVENWLHIRAPHHPIDKNVAIEITIQPKMSFGTGHHNTTYLMSKNMFQMEFQNKSVLDIGTGTGILSIVAEKLNAQKIVAVDNDPICIENATENIMLNHCNHIEIKHSADFLNNDIYDIILANIHQQYLTENVALLHRLLSPQGMLLVSGFLEENITRIKMLFDNYFCCKKQEIKTSNEHWAFLMFEKK